MKTNINQGLGFTFGGKEEDLVGMAIRTWSGQYCTVPAVQDHQKVGYVNMRLICLSRPSPSRVGDCPVSPMTANGRKGLAISSWRLR